METFYLVDYENVGSGGVSKCSGLSKTDHLIIFYTENSKKIDLDIVDNHGAAIFETQKVPAKSQSVDMHIVSYMGYLIGRNEGKSIKIVIVSKDKDYDNLVKYWKDKANISRTQKIETAEKKKAETPKKSDEKKSKTTAKQTFQKTPVKKTPTKSEIKTQLNIDIQKILAQNGYPKDAINGIAKLVCKRYGKDNFKQQVHNDLRQDYGVTYDEIYKLIKSTLTKYS